MIDYTRIGQRIAAHRKGRCITQEQMAEHLDVSIAFISKIERGRTQLSLERLVQICHFLGLSPDELLSQDQPASDSYMQTELFSLLEQCPHELLPVIKAMIEDILRYYPRQT